MNTDRVYKNSLKKGINALWLVARPALLLGSGLILLGNWAYGQTPPNAPTYSPPILKRYTSAELNLKPARKISLVGKEMSVGQLPDGLKMDPELCLIAHRNVSLQRLYAAPDPYGLGAQPRGLRTPKGDLLVAFPAGQGHVWGATRKVNDMYSVRSTDNGRSWSLPKIAWETSFNAHGFNPVVPAKGNRIYTFGQEAPVEQIFQPHSGPLGMRYSDDDGRTWTEPIAIKPVNDPTYKGVCHMQMAQTDAGTWILGTYTIRVREGQAGLMSRRTDTSYVLRSTDQGTTWTLLPGKRPNGLVISENGVARLLEGRALHLDGNRVVMFYRTPFGKMYAKRSQDDGLTWSDLEPVPLKHPDAPPMIFKLSDQKTLIAFIHNRLAEDTETGRDRGELWFSLSTDEGRSWSEPRFLLMNAAGPTDDQGFGRTQVSYGDLVADNDELHLFFDHKQKYILYARFRESDLHLFPTASDLIR